MKKKIQMREFDIEKAKAGAPVCTRDGRPVRIICFDYQEYGQQEADEKFPIIALVKYDEGERAYVYRESGKCRVDKNDELVMAPVKREGWVVINPEEKRCFQCVFDTQEEADTKASSSKTTDLVVAHIEWEE